MNHDYSLKCSPGSGLKAVPASQKQFRAQLACRLSSRSVASVAFEGQGIPPLLVKILPLRNYVDSFKIMKQHCLQRDANTSDEIWLLQHHPVITLGVRSDLCDVSDAADVPVVRSDRGGKTTCHGPGQWLLYALLDLPRRKMRVRNLVTLLEGSVVSTCRQHGVIARRQPSSPGVFVNGAKIAFLGLRVRSGCSYHGIAFNVSNDLSGFRHIVCCGVANQPVVRFCDLSGDDPCDVPAHFLENFLFALMGQPVSGAPLANVSVL